MSRCSWGMMNNIRHWLGFYSHQSKLCMKLKRGQNIVNTQGCTPYILLKLKTGNGWLDMKPDKIHWLSIAHQYTLNTIRHSNTHCSSQDMRYRRKTYSLGRFPKDTLSSIYCCAWSKAMGKWLHIYWQEWGNRFLYRICSENWFLHRK